MKENLTKFDLEAAFKSLDEISYPKAEGGVRPRKVMTEQMHSRLRTDVLMEEYYSVNDTAELGEAREDREGEVAKAKLSRIEKIVDLDAYSPEDLLPSYVGKLIMQCPQCMTLFYKKPEEIEHSDDGSEFVNIGEKCQHCGNDSGYALIGKVDEVAEDEMANYDTEAAGTEEVPTEEEAPAEEVPTEEEEMPAEEFDLDAMGEEEPQELTEGVDPELNKKLDEHNDYIGYLQKAIEENEKKLASEKNEFIKQSIQDCIDALNTKLEEAIPDDVKAVSEAPVDDTEVIDDEGEDIDAEEANELPGASGELSDKPETLTEQLNELLDVGVNVPINLDADVNARDVNVPIGVSALEEAAETAEDLPSPEEVMALLDSPEFKKPIDEEDVDAIFDEADDDFDDIDDIDEDSVDDVITEYLSDVYKNTDSFEIEECKAGDKQIFIEGIVKFKSGKSSKATFGFNKLTGKTVLEGTAIVGGKKITESKKPLRMAYTLTEGHKCLKATSVAYNYAIGKTIVEGYTKH